MRAGWTTVGPARPHIFPERAAIRYQEKGGESR